MAESEQNGTFDPDAELTSAARDLRAAARQAAEAGASFEEIAAQLGVDTGDVADLIDGA